MITPDGWWNTVIMRAHDQRCSESFVAWSDLETLRAEIDRLGNNLIAQEQITLLRNKDLLKAQAEVVRLEADVRRLTQVGAQAEAEVERLRAELRTERMLWQNQMHAQALEAEARLREVVEALLAEVEWRDDPDRPAQVITRSRDALAAAQPEEKTKPVD